MYIMSAASANTQLDTPCNDNNDSRKRNVKISSLSHVQLHHLVTSKCHSAYSSTEWKGQIYLPLHPFQTGMDHRILFDSELKERDLCSYLDGCNGFVIKLYLDPKKYPPPVTTDSRDEKKTKLDAVAVDSLIRKRAKEAGCPVVLGKSEGLGDPKKFRRTYLCEHCNSNSYGSSAAAKSKSVQQAQVSSVSYRETHLVNNKMKGRRKGVGKGAKGATGIPSVPIQIHKKV